MPSASQVGRIYRDIGVKTGVSGSNQAHLVQMLFDGLLESLSTAKGSILRGENEAKAHNLNRASKILFGLQGALNHESGGQLAQNLGELYSYALRRVVKINANNDAAGIDELHGLFSEISGAWGHVVNIFDGAQNPSVTFTN